MSDLVLYKENNVISTYDEMERAAKAMAGSGFFSDTKQASQAIVKILAAREIGLGPFAGMTGVNIIQGKPAFGANIMAACVKKSGRYNYRITEMNDKACTIEFMERLDGKWTTSGESKFTIDDARKAGTKNLDKFPRNMLFARAMSNGVRWYCPDVMNGSVVYTPEELGVDVDEDGNVVQTEEIIAGEFEPELEPAQLMPSADEKPTSKGKYTRPMQPEVLREALQTKAAKASPATEKQTNLVRMLLLEHFADRDDERYQAQEYLTGQKSFSDIDPKMISALLDWMKPVKNPDGSGSYLLDKDAKLELTMVARKFMEDKGQQTFDI